MVNQTTEIKGMACHGKGKALVPWSYESGPLREEDVRIKISHCGICHSDIHTLDSGWGETKYPVIVGHEIVGLVTEVGRGVSGVKVGDRVGVGAQCGACHSCENCQNSQENICQKGTFTYNSVYPDGKIAQGGYAEAIVCPFQFVFQIPKEISSAEAAPLLCAGATVYAPLKRFMKKGDRVGVVGIGGLGHLGIQFAKALGASEVVAITSSLKKKKDALELGSTAVLNSSDIEAFGAAKRSLDVILCTVSSHEINWESYISLLNFHGTFIVVGVPEESISLNLGVLIFGQISLVGSLIASPSEIEMMLKLAKDKNVRPWVELSPMAQVNEALDKVRKNQVRFRYVLEN